LTKEYNFTRIQKKEPTKRKVNDRVQDFQEIEKALPEQILQQQASRCMDCGVAFCHSFGCPLANRIPDINTLVYRGKWREALEMLHATNNFPEFTGKLCPALCEASCTLELDYTSVAIKQIENKIVEKGWQEGWIKPQQPDIQLSQKIAIIGSGPTGLTAAQELARTGFQVTVFEKSAQLGGLLRYGIPDFKMDKKILGRRLQQLYDEGIRFETRVEIGRDISVRYLLRSFDAVLFAVGTPKSKRLDLPGNSLKGITSAHQYLTQQNKLNSGEISKIKEELNARNKDVVIIGGGDTGSDCMGTALRQGAASVTMLEILPKPPQKRSSNDPWPLYPHIFRKSSSMEEGGEILWSTLTTEFIGEKNNIKAVKTKQVQWSDGNFETIPGSEKQLAAGLVIQSLGFELDTDKGLYSHHGMLISDDGNLRSHNSRIFTAGDCATGPSLIVNTINEGRQAAQKIIKKLL